MDFNPATLWWVLGGVLVVCELLSGTFYLLMLALGCGAGALAAHAGWGSTAQLLCAALVGGGATAAWHLKRARHPRSAPAESNRDVNLDIGQTVKVEAWGVDGLARVHYRGASWEVHFVGEGTPQPGDHIIVALRGNRFDVSPAQAPASAAAH